MTPSADAPHVLVLANAPFDARLLGEALAFRGIDPLDAEICVAAPARRHVQARLAACSAALEELGVVPYAWIADADPLTAIEDALTRFAATDIVIVDDLRDRFRRDGGVAVAAAARRPLPIVEVLRDGDDAVIVALERTALLAA